MTWPLVSMGEVLARRPLDVLVESQESYTFAGVRSFGRGVFRSLTRTGSQTAYKELTRVRAGDITYPKLMAWEGAIGMVPDECAGCVVSPEFPVFEVDRRRVLPEYLDYWWRSPVARPLLSGGSTGLNVRRRRLHPSDFLAIKVPIPPLEVQGRVVASLNHLLGLLNRAERVRDESSRALRSLARAELTSRVAEITGASPTIPLGRAAQIRGGIQKTPQRAAGKSPRRYLTVAHVQRDDIRTSDPRYFEVSDNELEQWRLEPGDVLVVEGNGSIEQIGRAALFRGEIPDCVHQNHVIRVRPATEVLLPEYLNAYLNSPVGQQSMVALARTMSGLYALSTERLRSLVVPIPTLDRQRELVTAVAIWRQQMDQIGTRFSTQSTAIAELRAQVVSYAFAGGL